MITKLLSLEHRILSPYSATDGLREIVWNLRTFDIPFFQEALEKMFKEKHIFCAFLHEQRFYMASSRQKINDKIIAHEDLPLPTWLDNWWKWRGIIREDGQITLLLSLTMPYTFQNLTDELKSFLTGAYRKFAAILLENISFKDPGIAKDTRLMLAELELYDPAPRTLREMAEG